MEQGEITWKQLSDYVNKEFREDEEHYRDESAYRKPCQGASAYYDEVFSKMISNEYSDNIAEQRRELAKERVKLQTEKLEYNRWLREEARDELIIEKIENSIRELPTFNVPYEIAPLSYDTRKAVLIISDVHYGVEFEIKGLFGDVINAYSPEIFEERMERLFQKTVDIIHQNNISELYVFDLGDGIDGIIRLTSQLMKLRYGVIDSTIKYANFLANWLNELSNYVRINFQMVKDSNHTQLRLCGASKGAFVDENMNKVMISLIKERLKNNPNVRITENPTGLVYANICGYNVLCIHGEVKNIGNAVNEFSRTYDTKINYLIGGHCHYSKMEEKGVDCEAISVKSIIGVDSYGLSLNKTSNAGTSLFIFESGLGKTCEYTIKLN